MYILIAILFFCFLIFIHELGHFITAKLTGVKVNEFALFMGPAIFKFKRGETTYRLNCLPIGGYCAMEGEDGENDDPRAFVNAKVWKRLIILCAGSFMNFLAGFLIVLLLLAFTAEIIPQKTVSYIEPESDLLTVGIREGDEFYKIDGKRVYTSGDISLLLDRNTTDKFDFTVIRDGKKIKLENVTVERKDFGDGTPRLGVSFTNYEDANFFNEFGYAWDNCRDYARLVWMGLGDLISGKAGLNDMGGPVKIVEVVDEAGKEAESKLDGVMIVINLFAFIAINLAVMNMLPIPALDGGRVFGLLVTWCLEKILRRKINPQVEGYIHAVGMILLLAFMAFITFKDIWSLF
ncbi:MAG: site-2 protease family protein [Clostridia bacterium]|nr:site-2 protease family protein [Clostridia bacterium]